MPHTHEVDCPTERCPLRCTGGRGQLGGSPPDGSGREKVTSAQESRGTECRLVPEGLGGGPQAVTEESREPPVGLGTDPGRELPEKREPMRIEITDGGPPVDLTPGAAPPGRAVHVKAQKSQAVSMQAPVQIVHGGDRETWATVDTGAEITLISEAVYDRMHPEARPPLEPSDRRRLTTSRDELSNTGLGMPCTP